MILKDILAPFMVWKRAFEKPYTTMKPLTERSGADRYRGFHYNDVDKCIGCGSCEEICQNAAIDLVPVKDPQKGNSGLRPRIDYGRCCWCALCVDICPSNSLTMSNEYIWVETDPDAYRFIPGVDEKPWDKPEKGYDRSDGYLLLEPERQEMEMLPLDEGLHSFVELIKGYSKEQAIKEADRCVECGICIASCPAHMHIPDYIRAIREDNLEHAIDLLYKTNPLPEVCGRICTHQCEAACTLGHLGDPIAIRWLKRYIADQIPAEKYPELLPKREPTNGKKVAIIGAGPSGLSAAYYLSLQGYQCTVFERLPQPGGMMRYGIPEYRLPYEQLDKDIAHILSLGVELQCNTTVGKDISLHNLHDDFDAVYTATGLHIGRSTRVPGTDHPDVYQAVDLLRDVSMGKEIPVMANVVVIGGGNVAMDITRTMARLQNKKFGKVQVIATSLECELEMPADREEIDEAREEKAFIAPGWGPEKVILENNKIKGLKVHRCTSVFDETGRFDPKFDITLTQVFPADMIIESIGQGMDLSYISEDYMEKLELDPRRRIKVNEMFQTSLPWLFAGGDIIQGPDVISGIANGHKAARGIDAYIKSVQK